MDAKQQRFGTFAELNAWLDTRCRALWQELKHPAGAGITVADAKVLSAIPAHGLEAVLVAVERVLESGVPSVEPMHNVLARLNPPPMPQQVETHLKLTEEPLADTLRYDSLSTQEVPHV